MRGGQNVMAGGSPGKNAKPMPAGILNSKTLAEENLKDSDFVTYKRKVICL